MTPGLVWLLIVWGVLTGVLIILLIYRSTLTMQEDDQLFLDESASAMAKEQSELMAKVNKITPLVKVLGATSGVMILVIAGWAVYLGLNSVQP
jgi:Tfp pilus assembly protein PilN